MNFLLERLNYKQTREQLGLISLALVWMSIVLSAYLDTLNLLVLLAVIALFIVRDNDVEDRVASALISWFTLVFLFFFVFSFFPLIVNNSSVEVWIDQFHERIAPVLAVGLTAVILLKYRLSEQNLWMSLLFVFFSLVIAIFLEWNAVGPQVFSDEYRFGINRISTSNYLIFGVVTNLFTALLLGASIWAYMNKKWLVFWLFIVASLLSVYGSILSGTRGAWIGLPEIIIGWGVFFYVSILGSVPIRQKILSILVVLLAFILLTVAVQEKLEHRFNLAVEDVERYFDGNPLTSIGSRFVMYEAAIDGFTEHPISGVGPENIGPEMEKRTQKIFSVRFGVDRPGYLTWDVHNQYLQELFARGIIGIFVLLVIQIYLLTFFIRRSSRKNLFAVAGVIFMVASILNMMSYSWLRFHGGMFFYFIVMTFLIYGSSIKSENNLANE